MITTSLIQILKVYQSFTVLYIHTKFKNLLAIVFDFLIKNKFLQNKRLNFK